MYHLLVQNGGWKKNSGTIARNRIFEFTDEIIKSKFNSLENELIASIPAVFIPEIDSTGPDLDKVQIGKIYKIINDENKNEIQFEYALHKEVCSFSVSWLQDLSVELGITDSFELRRTHWSIKNVDLYQVLFENMMPTPKVFAINPSKSASNHISVMMPFDAKYKNVYDKIKEVAENLNLTCFRADDIWDDDLIIQDIVSLISNSNIVIADCTKRNPNVFYEIGIAHTLGRNVILITQNEDDVPFDLGHLRYIFYLNNAEGLNELGAKLQDRIGSLLS